MAGSDATADTRDAASKDGGPAWLSAHADDERHPRVRLLYHPDLDRVGSLSLPGAVSSRWLALGRNEPAFGGLGGPARPIEDPHVSREQLRIRFRPDVERFEVDPVPGARRAIGLVHLQPGSTAAAVSPITVPTLLEPGACLAIGAALVTGPTGAGKELVARALHRQSPRAAGPFVAVNCAALPETLVEAVLFGHTKGAFTGADTEGKGLFRAADGGTLFLDELGELPLAVQPKLLRALQDGVVVPVGAYEGRRVDVRIVAATHRDLPEQVRVGGLREDLYHRMSAHVLCVPPLAAHCFDVPELFVHLLRQLRAKHPSLAWLWESGRAWQPAVPIGFVAGLLRQPWSGNVRELQNVAERTARLNLRPGAFHAPAPLTASLWEEPASALEPKPPVVDAILRLAGETLGLAHKTVLKLLSPDVLTALEARAQRDGDDHAETARRLRAAAAEALLALLDRRSFNQSAVATALGTSRTTLIKLMDDLALPRAADLDAAAIARARAEAGGDLDAAARLLHVSRESLKKRLARLNLRTRG